MFRRYKGVTAYLLIAFALFLIVRALTFTGKESLAEIILYLSIAVSLLAGNIPRIVDIPLHYVYPIRLVELFTFFVALCCFVSLCAVKYLIH